MSNTIQLELDPGTKLVVVIYYDKDGNEIRTQNIVPSSASMPVEVKITRLQKRPKSDSGRTSSENGYNDGA